MNGVIKEQDDELLTAIIFTARIIPLQGHRAHCYFFISLLMYKTLTHRHSISPTRLSRCYVRPGFFWSRNQPPSLDERKSFPRKTSQETASYSIPPARSNMLLRDFLDDSLYNPHYGYYAKQSPILEFEGMRQEEDYIQYMNRLSKSYGRTKHKTIQQLRYTLTEIFKVKTCYYFT